MESNDDAVAIEASIIENMARLPATELEQFAAFKRLKITGRSVEDIAKLASMAKSKLSEVFQLVSNEGVQMHGGIGMTDEFDVGFFIKRARVAQQFLGDASFHRDRYASLYSF